MDWGTVPLVSILILKERLRTATSDERITLAEVESLVRAAQADGSTNEMEEFFLTAALEAHAHLFDADAYAALQRFLQEHPPKPR